MTKFVATFLKVYRDIWKWTADDHACWLFVCLYVKPHSTPTMTFNGIIHVWEVRTDNPTLLVLLFRRVFFKKNGRATTTLVQLYRVVMDRKKCRRFESLPSLYLRCLESINSTFEENYPLVNVYQKRWNITTIVKLGKSTKSGSFSTANC